jgi:hypothetical protein
MPEAAREALREFGGLKVGRTGAGRDMGKNSLEFDPRAGDELWTVEDATGRVAYPLGDVDGGHGSFGIDETGQAYIDYLRVVVVTGPSLDALITRALLGIRPPPDCVLMDENPLGPLRNPGRLSRDIGER